MPSTVPFRRPRKPKRRENPETPVQRAVLELLHRLPEVAWAHRINTGAATMVNVDRKTGAPKGQPRFVRFGFEGCSDVLGQLKARHGGRLLAIECKAPGAVPTEDQAAFLEAVRAAGGVAFWVDDVAKVIPELRRQLEALGRPTHTISCPRSSDPCDLADMRRPLEYAAPSFVFPPSVPMGDQWRHGSPASAAP